MNLYELQNEYLDLINKVEDGELDKESALAELNKIKGEIKSKVLNIGFGIKNIKSDAIAIDAEIDRLKDKAQMLEAREKKLKEFLLFVMQRLNVKGFKDPVLPIRRQKNPQPSVIIEDESLIPDDYKTSVVKTDIDKRSLAKDFEVKGIKGVRVEFGEHLRIG